jgi:uncharacterized protein YecA (UPF0149 family)
MAALLEAHPTLPDTLKTRHAQMRALYLRSLHRAGRRPAAPVRREAKVGRNDPCPCGSGKKYKKCCGR